MSEATYAHHARVVVVDDRADTRDAIQALLTDAGHDVVAVDGFDAADAAVFDHSPRLVVVRVADPAGEGATVIASMLRHGVQRPRSIALCADNPEVVQAAVAAGADDILLEPLRAAELIARVRSGIGHWVDANRADLLAGETRRRDGTLQTISGAMSQGLVIVGGDGRVVDANAAMGRIVGRPIRELVGQEPPFPWWSTEGPDDVTAALRSACSSGGGDVDAEVERPDGVRLPVSITVARDREGSMPGYMMLVTDRSEQVRVRRALQSALTEQASLRRVARAVAGEPDTERVFTLIGEEIANVFHVECGTVLRFMNDVATVQGTPSPDAFFSPGEVVPVTFDAAVARVAHTGTPARVAYDYLSGDGVGAGAREAGVVCSVAAPIRVDQELWGAVLLSTCRSGGIADERSRLSGFAEMAGLALENAAARQRLERAATIDELTNLPNRRAFDDAIMRETERARRYERPLTLVMFDLDRMGVINERLGHDVGDEAIAGFATILTDCCRLTDLVARTGGTEFACLMPDTDGEAGRAYAERVRRAATAFPTPGGMPTCSVGVAQWRDVEDSESLVSRAGQALYRAKHMGRDRVSLAADEPLAA